VRELGSRGHRAALPKIEAVVLGRELKTSDLTEKMVFFEAYGVLSGPEAIPHLKSLLAPGGGFMRKRQEPAIRACAAMALGKIRTPEARAALEETAADKDPLVRNAVTKALREAVG
jgi:HEAT repeat protein